MQCNCTANRRFNCKCARVDRELACRLRLGHAKVLSTIRAHHEGGVKVTAIICNAIACKYTRGRAHFEVIMRSDLCNAFSALSDVRDVKATCFCWGELSAPDIQHESELKLIRSS